MTKATMTTLLGVALGCGPCLGAQEATPEPSLWRHLTTETAQSVTQGWQHTQTDAAITGRPLSIAGKKYRKGLGTHAPGEMVFRLGRKHRRFRAEVGVDDAAPRAGSVVFQVLLDGKEAFNSGIVRAGEPARPIALDVTGVDELRLVVTDAGDGVEGDHADWADAAVDDSAASVAKPVPRFSTAGFYAIAGSPRQVFSFNPGWRFHKGEAKGAEQPGFDDSAWEAANLPHGLEILGENASGMRNYQGPAWYRKRFKLPAAAKGQKLVLYFEAVMGKAQVWVNGRKAAEHFGGYLPFAAEIGDLLAPDGRENVVAVRADNADDPTYPPGKLQGDLDFTYLGGIYRDAYLITTGPVHVTLPELSRTVAGGGVFVAVKDVNGRDAEIEVRTEVANSGSAARRLTLRTVLEDGEGREVLRREESADLAAGGVRAFVQALSPKNVHLWHPDDPYLHTIRTEVLDGEKVLDSLRTRFGIRLFEMRGDQGFFVNKQYIGHKLSGVNRHQDYVYVGNALPNSGQWRDAKLLREGGSNVIRAAHYPLDPAFMDACDELGLLVTVANPGWQFYNDKEPLFAQRVKEDTRAMVRRDRNRPAVLLWETALNETDHQPIPMLREMHRIVHEEFPFPGAFTVTDVDHAKAAGFDFTYHGGMNEPTCSLTREYGDGGEVDNFFSHNAVTRVKREWGEQPMLNQAMVRAHDLDEVYATPPKRIGATLWCGIDHQRGYHPDPFWGGLLDVYRVPRYSYFLFKSQYDPGFLLPGIETGPMVSIAHELTQASPKDVLIFTNCEEVRLTWLGKVVGTRKPEAGYGHMPHPPVLFKDVFDFHEISTHWRNQTHDIQMVAEGLIGGKVVCREVKRYPERTTALKLVVDDAGIGVTADGADFVPVRALVVDNKGVLKVLASESVHFEVEGPGEIIGGPANGANPMRTEFGTATALVRAGTQPGVIRVRAFAEGLLPAEEVFIVTAAPTTPLLGSSAPAPSAQAPAPTAASVPARTAAAVTLPADVRKLQEEIRRLRLELVSREQEIQELKSKAGR